MTDQKGNPQRKFVLCMILCLLLAAGWAVREYRHAMERDKLALLELSVIQVSISATAEDQSRAIGELADLARNHGISLAGAGITSTGQKIPLDDIHGPSTLLLTATLGRDAPARYYALPLKNGADLRPLIGK